MPYSKYIYKKLTRDKNEQLLSLILIKNACMRIASHISSLSFIFHPLCRFRYHRVPEQSARLSVDPYSAVHHPPYPAQIPPPSSQVQFNYINQTSDVSIL